MSLNKIIRIKSGVRLRKNLLGLSGIILASVGGGSELAALKAAFLEIRTTRRAFEGNLMLPFGMIWSPLPVLNCGGLNIPWLPCGGDCNNAAILSLVALSVAGGYLFLGLLTDVILFILKIFIGCWSLDGFMSALPWGSS